MHRWQPHRVGSGLVAVLSAFLLPSLAVAQGAVAFGPAIPLAAPPVSWAGAFTAAGAPGPPLAPIGSGGALYLGNPAVGSPLRPQARAYAHGSQTSIDVAPPFAMPGATADCFAPGDLDGDGRVELVWCVGSGVSVAFGATPGTVTPLAVNWPARAAVFARMFDATPPRDLLAVAQYRTTAGGQSWISGVEARPGFPPSVVDWGPLAGNPTSQLVALRLSPVARGVRAAPYDTATWAGKLFHDVAWALENDPNLYLFWMNPPVGTSAAGLGNVVPVQISFASSHPAASWRFRGVAALDAFADGTPDLLVNLYNPATTAADLVAVRADGTAGSLSTAARAVIDAELGVTRPERLVPIDLPGEQGIAVWDGAMPAGEVVVAAGSSGSYRTWRHATSGAVRQLLAADVTGSAAQDLVVVYASGAVEVFPGTLPPALDWAGGVAPAVATRNGSLTVAVEASDPDGSVAKVELFVNGAPVAAAADLVAPYVLEVPPAILCAAAPGATLDLVVRATDDLGATREISALDIPYADSAPGLSWAAALPEDAPRGEPLTVALSAADCDGDLAQVTLSVNGSSPGTLAAPPFELTLGSDILCTASSPLTIEAQAVDGGGRASTIADTVVLTGTGDISLSWAAGHPPASARKSLPLDLEVGAAACGEMVVRVDGFVGGSATPTATALGAPYRLTIPPVGACSADTALDVVVRATSASGKTASLTTSIPLVEPNVPPVIGWASGPPPSLSKNASAAFAVDATDCDGTVARVDLYLEGSVTPAATDGTPPFDLPVDAAAICTAGDSLAVRLVATDDQGGTAELTAEIPFSDTAVPALAWAPGQPPPGASKNATLSLEVDASDCDGAIAKVELFLEGSATASATSGTPPWLLPVPDAAVCGAGPALDVRVVATDDRGATSTLSAEVPFTDSRVPTLAWTSGPPPLTASKNAAVALEVDASDCDGAVDRVELFLEGSATPYAADTTPPYAFSVPPAALCGAGPALAVEVRATDDSSASASLPATVTFTDSLLPELSWAAGQPPPVASKDDPVVLAVEASDCDGGVASVDLLLEGSVTPFATAVGAPWTFTVPPSAACSAGGALDVVVRATDVSGDRRERAGAIPYSDTADPVVTWRAGAPPAAASRNAPLRLEVDATDCDGAVANVALFVEGSTGASASAALPPYDLVLPAAALCTVGASLEVVIRATDADGDTGEASATIPLVDSALPEIAWAAGSPPAGAGKNAPVLLDVTASDCDGTVDRVELFVEGAATPLASLTSAPYHFEVPAAGFCAAGAALDVAARVTDDAGGQREVAASIPFVDSVRPTLAWTGGAPPASASKNAPLTLDLQPADCDGTIAKVDLFLEGAAEPFATAVGAPWTFTVPPPTLCTAGAALELVARATDDRGGTIEVAAAIPFSDTATPTLAWRTAPPADASKNAPLDLAVDAADCDGTIARVELLVDGAISATRAGVPYDFSIAPAALCGTGAIAALTVRAVDDRGATAELPASVAFTDTVLPELSWAAGQPPAIASKNASVALAVEATDCDDGVTSVDLLLGGTLHATRAAPPWTFTVDPAALCAARGALDVLVRAADASGGRRELAAAIPFSDTAAPVVTWRGGAPPASASRAGPVALQVDAADCDGTVAAVALFVEGSPEPLATAAVPPFDLEVPPRALCLAGDALDVLVRATDGDGDAGTVTASIPLTGSVLPELAWASGAPPGPSSKNAPLALELAATDCDGGVAAVELFLEGASEPFATVTVPPYRFEVPPAALCGAGATLELTTRATDVDGARRELSASIPFTDSARPAVAWASAPPATASKNLPLPLEVAASDCDGAVDRVELFLEGAAEPFAAAGSPPYAFSVPVAELCGVDGALEVVARATSDDGGARDLATTVLFTDSVQPAVRWPGGIAPAAAARGGPVTLEVEAADCDGSVAEVALFVEGRAQPLATASAPPWSFTIAPAELCGAGGALDVAFRATDASGDRAELLGAVPLVGSAPPSLAWRGGAPPPSASKNEPATFEVEATDCDGAVSAVDLYVEGGAIPAVTLHAPPYAFALPPGELCAAGASLDVTVRAVDDSGERRDLSASLPFTDSALPTLAWAGAALSEASRNAPLALAFDAADCDGTISSVQLFLEGSPTPVAAAGAPPWAFEVPLDALCAAGTSLQVRARATDDAGRTRDLTADLPFTDQRPPLVAWTDPPPTEATAGVPLHLAVEASDCEGLAGVALLVGDDEVATADGPGPHLLEVPPEVLCSAGATLTVTARARDLDDAFTDTSAILSVAAAQPVAWISPASGRLVLSAGDASFALEGGGTAACPYAFSYRWNADALPAGASVSQEDGPTGSVLTLNLPESATAALATGAPAPSITLSTSTGGASATASLALVLDATRLVEVEHRADRAALAPGEMALLVTRLRNRLGVPLPGVRFRDHLDGLDATGPARVRGATLAGGGAFDGGWEAVLDQLPARAEVVVELPVRSAATGSGSSHPEVLGPTGLALSPAVSAAAAPGVPVGCGCGGTGGPSLAPLALLALALAASRGSRRRRGPPWCRRRASG